MGATTLTNKSLVTPYLHGFLRNCSCKTQLLSVPHVLILWGDRNPSIAWFADFLNNRRHRVVVDGVASRCVPVTSRAPQGSILGLTLFVILINVIPELVDETSPALFADDTKIYKGVKSVTDCGKLQQIQ